MWLPGSPKCKACAHDIPPGQNSALLNRYSANCTKICTAPGQGSLRTSLPHLAANRRNGSCWRLLPFAYCSACSKSVWQSLPVSGCDWVRYAVCAFPWTSQSSLHCFQTEKSYASKNSGSPEQASRDRLSCLEQGSNVFCFVSHAVPTGPGVSLDLKQDQTQMLFTGRRCHQWHNIRATWCARSLQYPLSGT